MKRKFTFLMAAFALLVFMMPSMVAWGQSFQLASSISVGDIVVITSTGTYGNSSFSKEMTGISTTSTTYGLASNFTNSPAGTYLLTIEAGSESDTYSFKTSDNKYLNWGSGNSLSLVSNKGKSSSWSVSFSGNDATVVNANDNTRKLVYNAGSPRFACYTSAQKDIQLYKQSGSSSTVATPAFNPIEGTYFEAQDVEIACETSGATLQYKLTENGAWQNYTSAIHVTETTTIWAKATLGEKTSEATATYTIPTLITMAAAHELENNAYGYVQGVVTFIDGRNVFAQDGTGGICLFLNDGTVPDGLAIGDLVRAYGQKTVYNGLIELKNIDGNSSAFTTVSTGNDLPLAVKTISEILTGASDELQSTRVKIENAVIGTINTSGNTPLTQDDNSINIYKVPELTDIQATNYVNVIGVIGYYNNPQVRVASADDVEKVVISTPTITVSTNTLNNFTYVAGSGPSDAQSFTVSGSNLSADITISLGNNSNFEISTSENSGYDNSLTLNQYEGTVSATLVYVRMKSDLSTGGYDDDIEITSGSVTPETINLSGTVTAPEAPNVTWNLAIASYDEITNPAIVTWSSAYATMTNSSENGGTSASNYLGGDSNNRTSSRFYQNNKWTLTPAMGYSITSVELTATSTNYANAFVGSTWTNAAAQADGTTVTVTPTNGSSAIEAVIGGTCGFTEVKVYYGTVAVAPVWSALPTPTINTGSNYMLDLSDYVTGSPTPTIALTSTTAVSSDYDFDAGVLDYTPATNGTYTFAFTATNSAGSADATLTITVATIYTILYSVNGAEGGEASVVAGNAIGTLPVPTENIPAGFTFVGWMVSPTHPYYNATTAPTLVEATDVVNDDMLLDAVFCIGETSQGTWSLSNTAPVAGDQVILSVEDGGNYYAMFASENALTSTSFTVSNNVITGTVPSGWVVEDASYTADNNDYTGLGLFSGQYKEVLGDQKKMYLHLNASVGKIATGFQNGVFEFGDNNILHGKVNGKYLTYVNQAFGVDSEETNACPLLIFKFAPGVTTNKDYTTSVISHADGSYIAENASETLYGIHYINGEVGALYELTNNGKLIINNGGVLDLSIVEFTNNAAANLIIEDGGQLIHTADVNATMLKDITGYGDDNTVTTGWYTIASPVATANIGIAATGTYDLYKYDEKNVLWLNQELPENNTLFESFNQGVGYLYGNAAGVELQFAGKMVGTSTEITVPLSCSATNVNLQGFNLVGNPFTRNLVAGDVKILEAAMTSYYYVAGGSELSSAFISERPIKPGEGFFVQTSAAGDLVLNPSSKGSRGMDKLAYVRIEAGNDNYKDQAFIQIGQGNTLNKMTINDNVAHVSVQNNNAEYAVATIEEAHGEMPVNFKAAENGTYTINVEAENLEVNYLHLIDNLTGMDVDLLATPSYTFEGKRTDYASRFRLVFDANNGNEENDDNFAFINNGELIVNGNGTVQVIDILGRQMFSHEVNSAFRIQNSEFAPGVYVLRLINGNNVKTQKIVVK